ncbi:MAG: hypothetical protein RLY87_501 [Chloroflexota bacterium]|jgi:hypothetical protein
MGHQHTNADISTYLDRFFHNPVARNAYERFFVDSLLYSNQRAPTRWVITHGKDHLNINVGLMHTLMLRHDWLEVMVDYAHLPLLAPNSDVGYDASEPDPNVGIYPSVPGSTYTYFDPDLFDQYATVVWEAHQRTIDKAALTRINPGVCAKHTPAALTYFATKQHAYLRGTHGRSGLPASHYTKK